MRWRQSKNRSLRRLARREQARLEDAPGLTRLRRLVAGPLWKLTHHRGWALLLALPAIGIAFLPISLSLNPFEQQNDAKSILQVLWQVEASAVALSLAVVVFILDSVYKARRRPSLGSLAEGIGLPAIFYADVYALVLTGMVLMGAGEGAPAGWAA